MKKIISLFLMFLLVFTFTNISAEELENTGTPNLEKATLLFEESRHFVTEINPFTFDDSSEHSPYGGYTLDYESGMFGEYSSYFVTIGSHLFVKWIQGRGQTYFLQMTISMNNLNLDYQYIPMDISEKFDYAEYNIALNTKQYTNEDFYASLFTDQNTIIVKDRQWMDFSYDYDIYTHNYTTRTGWFLNYKYNHFYNKKIMYLIFLKLIIVSLFLEEETLFYIILIFHLLLKDRKVKRKPNTIGMLSMI